MIDLGHDAVVYVDCEEHRLVTKVLQDNNSSRRLRIISNFGWFFEFEIFDTIYFVQNVT